jgi:hypothetical protein
MGEEEKKQEQEIAAAVEAVSGKVTMLKKAGVPTAIIVLVMLLSIPGIQKRFFDDTDKEALAKTELSYQLLKAQTEELGKRVIENSVQVEKLRETINAMLLQRSAVGLSALRPPPVPEPVVAPASMMLLQQLPANLDGMAQARMAAE